MADVRSHIRDCDDLLAAIDERSRFVLLGEVTHGTQEFYELRSAVTRRLISERGFRAVAVEADWPAAARVNATGRASTDAPRSASAGAEPCRRSRTQPASGWRDHGPGRVSSPGLTSC